MRVCAGCTCEYSEDYKFCPDCGRGFGQAADDQRAKLNAGLFRLAANASQELSMERTKSFSAPMTESAQTAAEVLTSHDPGIRGLVNDG